MRILLLTLLLLTSFPLSASSVTNIIGTAVSNPLPPTGSCAGLTFNLQDISTTNTFDTGLGSGGNSFRSAPQLSVAWGAASSTGQGIRLGMVNLATPGLISQAQLNVNNNDPDATNSFSAFFNSINNQIYLPLSQVVAPCNVTPCLHVKRATATTIIGDTVFSSTRHDAAPDIAHAVDTASIFIQTFDSSVNQATLRKFTNPDLIAGCTTALDAAGGVVDQWADDGLFLYGPKRGTSVIYRVNKSTCALTSFTIVGAALLQSAITTDTANLYAFGAVSGGVAHLYKIPIASMTLSATLNLGATEIGSSQGLSYDGVNNKVYFLSDTGAGPWIFRRIDPSPFAIAQSISNTDGGRTGWVGAPDFLHLRYWFQDVGTPSHLHQILLCS